MKIGIIGSGAIGLYYGSMLQRSGQDVHFLMRRDYGAVSQNGLKIHSVKENFELPKSQPMKIRQTLVRLISFWLP